MTLLELVVAGLVGGLVALAAFQWMTYVARAAHVSSSGALARQLMDQLLKTTKTNFQRRYWEFQSAGGGPRMPGVLAVPPTDPVFSANPGKPSSFQCPDKTFPSCRNLEIVQLASTNPDTFRSVSFKTSCQAKGTTKILPPDFSPADYQPDGGGCDTPPVVSMTVAPYPAGGPSETFTYTGDQVLGSALCVRTCVIAPEAGVTKPAVVDYHLEIAVLHRGPEGKVAVLKGTNTLSTGDATEGAQILPR